MMYLYALVIICLFDVQTTRKFKRITKKMVQMKQFDIFYIPLHRITRQNEKVITYFNHSDGCIRRRRM